MAPALEVVSVVAVVVPEVVLNGLTVSGTIHTVAQVAVAVKVPEAVQVVRSLTTVMLPFKTVQPVQ